MTKVGDFWYVRQFHRFNSRYFINTMKMRNHLIGLYCSILSPPPPLPNHTDFQANDELF